MDIAGIISELLEHQEKLVVPGLGTFYRSRLEGYYSKEQQQFYPPSLQLQFNQELQEDDNVLVQALATDSSTSVSTARYHLDKYVSGIIQLAATESIPLGELGTFSIRRSQLVFMPKKLNNNNELFYGLAPVRLRRNRMKEGAINKPVVQMPYTEKPSAFTAALLRGEPMPGKPLSSVNNKNEVEEEEPDAEGKKPARISTGVLIIALVILISGIGLIVAYKMNPALFDRFIGQSGPPPVTTTTEKSRKRQISDSIQRAIQAQKDIGATPVIDSSTKSKILAPEAPRDTFGIVIGTFATAEGAKKEYDRYSYTGLNVEVRKKPGDFGKRYQITVASYFNIDSAKKHMPEFSDKLKLPHLFIETYPYKKQ